MAISIKGKNGWFNFKEALIEMVDCLGNKDLLLQVFSARKPWRNLAPVCIQGPKAEVEAFLVDLLEKVRALP